MRNKFAFICVTALLLLFTTVHNTAADGTSIERVSVASDGTQANVECAWPRISGTGRYVTFESAASNLVEDDDTRGVVDVFVRDRQTNTTTMVSVSSNGIKGNWASWAPSISDDGRYIAFLSYATNLVPNDMNSGIIDIFVRDLRDNTTTIVSISDNGTQGNDMSLYPSISGNGRYVAFESSATNLVSNDTNQMRDIFVRDLLTNTTTIASISANFAEANNESRKSCLNYDGGYVAFDSAATNLVSGDTNDIRDVFIRDLRNNNTSRVDISDDGAQGNNGGIYPSVSYDGRFIAFMSYSSNLVTGDGNNNCDVFVYDQLNHTINMVSIASDSTQGNTASFYPSISGDGRYVAFASNSSNLVKNDTNNQWDIFVHDCQTNETAMVNVRSDGVQGNDQSWDPNISGNGSFISFQSSASNLVPNDTNGVPDIFVADNPLYEELPPHTIPPSPPPPPPPTPPTPPPVPSAVTPRSSPSLPRQLNPAQISLQYLNVNPQQAQANQPLTIAGNVVNTGDQAGNYYLNLKINGRSEQTRMVSVGPQTSQPVKFIVAKSEPGTYTVDIGGQRNSFTVLGESQSSSSASKGGLIAIIAASILILISTIILLINRRTA